MIAIQGGTFTMGSSSKENGRHQNEGPERQVTIRSFAVGRFEITNFEYVTFLNSVKSRGSLEQPWFLTKSEDEFKSSQITKIAKDKEVSKDKPYAVEAGKENHPVFNVSWYGAKAYVEWLSRKTGQNYRLLTEAEWEYVAGAKQPSAFWWGTTISAYKANYDGTAAYRNGPGSFYRGKTLPVNSLKPNQFGLYHTHGNVWELVEDCWHDSYQGAPTDGSGWLDANNGNCQLNVIRGGSLDEYPKTLRTRSRSRINKRYRYNDVGFRVARVIANGELAPSNSCK